MAGSFLGGCVVSLVSGDGLALKPSGLIGSVGGALAILAVVGGIQQRQKQQQRDAALKASRSGRHQH